MDEKKLTVTFFFKLVADNQPSYKWLGGGVHVEASFPLTADGKVDRESLRKKVLEARERGPE